MKWIKKERILAPQGKETGIMVPIPYLVSPKKLRIFIGRCDEKGISRISYIDVNPSNPSEIIYIHDKPIIDIGSAGSFDDHGVVPMSIVEKDNKLFMFYGGFRLKEGGFYSILGGISVSINKGESFTKLSSLPLIPENPKSTYIRTASTIIFDEGKWKMWYLGGREWIEDNNKKKLPVYSLWYVESDSLLEWPNEGKIVLSPDRKKGEFGFGRPLIYKDNGYKMLYSIRALPEKYLLGYATSEDGINWQCRDSEVGINVSENGWDSENINLGHPFTFDGRTYLFYNGNGYGKSGFGWAELA